MIDAADRRHLARCSELAERGRRTASPHPVVGAVIVRDGAVVGEGWHERPGGDHAEVVALRAAGDARGATMYVSLEPCSHHGRTPPCADALVAAGVARVVTAMIDPTPKVNGAGAARLRDAGVAVEVAGGEIERAARRQNAWWLTLALLGRPHVTYKAAVSTDGRTASPAGPRWISSSQSRAAVHELRAQVGAVAVGIGTALADDPLLTAREVGATRQPTRVVFDSAARLPLGSRLVCSLDEAPVVVVCGPEAPADRVATLREAGVEAIPVAAPGAAGVSAALEELGRRGLTSLMLEGGATLAGAFLEASAIDVMRLFVAPVVLGGDARPLFAGPGPAAVGDAPRPLSSSSERIGEDVLIDARLREW